MELRAQAQVLVLTPDEVDRINTDLARAVDSGAFDPMHTAWKTLTTTIKRER
jgi:hypothetical protein